MGIKKVLFFLLLPFAVLIISGCQGQEGKAKLGNLAGATVDIFRVDDNGKIRKILQQKTTSRDTLKESGKFYTLAEICEDNKLYIIQVQGGCDWDANNDGLRDEECTPNKGIIRAVASGKELKKLGKRVLNVTMLSEIQYRKIARYLKYGYKKSEVFLKLKEFVESVIKKDIDGDGKITQQDLLLFDPIIDKKKLTSSMQKDYKNFAQQIRDGYAFSNDNLMTIHQFNIAGMAEKLYLSKSYLYVAGGNTGLQIIDVRNPFNPKKVAHLDTAGFAKELVVFGNYLYLAVSGVGLQIIDITEPKDPKVISSIEMPGGVINSIAIKGHYVYVTAFASLKIIDTTSLKHPKVISNVIVPEAGSLALFDHYVYIAAYDEGLHIVDIANPLVPKNIGAIKSFDSSIRDVYVAGKFLYMLNDNYGLQAIPLNGIANNMIVASKKLKEGATDLVVYKKLAFIASGQNGIQIVDIAYHGFKTVTNLELPGAHGIYISGEYAYVAKGEKGISIVDLALYGDLNILLANKTRSILQLAHAPSL